MGVEGGGGHTDTQKKSKVECKHERYTKVAQMEIFLGLFAAHAHCTHGARASAKGRGLRCMVQPRGGSTGSGQLCN